MASYIGIEQIDFVGKKFGARSAFFISGFGMGCWAPLVPYAQQRTQVDDGLLGTLLLCLGAGSFLMMPATGVITGRYGCRIAMFIAAALIFLSLPILATSNSFLVLMIALFVFGAGVGMGDVTMNIQGALVEQEIGRPCMSGFHALFSVGALTSAVLVTAMLWIGLTPLISICCSIFFIALVLFAGSKHFLSYGKHEESSGFSWPSMRILAIALCCFICFLSEGSMLDWSAVFLTSFRALEAAQAGVGYAAFGVAMTVGRFYGDWYVGRFGARAVLLFSGVVAAAGFGLTIGVNHWGAALAGFALIGIGAANAVPILTTLASVDKSMPSNISVAIVTSIGYLGILAGPAGVGFVSDAWGLSTAFFMVAILMLGVGILAPRLYQK